MDDLKLQESYRRYVYDDATGLPLKTGDTIVGTPTIGIGRNLLTVGLSEPEAVMLAANDVSALLFSIRTVVPFFDTLSENRQRALCNMAFNMGLQSLRGFRKMLGAMQAGNWQAANDECLDSKYAKDVGKRAAIVAAMILNG